MGYYIHHGIPDMLPAHIIERDHNSLINISNTASCIHARYKGSKTN